MRDERAEARADERDAHEVREHEHERAGDAAEERGEEHAAGVGDAHHRARDRRAEDEAVDGEDDAEEAVAGETRYGAADEEKERGRQGVGVRQHHSGQTSRRPSSALVIVTSSAYSRSLPTGTPIAMRVTLTPSGLSSRAR